MDKFGRQSIYIKDKALVAALKHLSADTDATLMCLVEVALRHLIEVATMASREGAQLKLQDLEDLLESAQEMTFSHRSTAGQRVKHPISSSL